MLRRFVPILCLILLGACSQEPGLPPLDNSNTILAFGNSLTYGSGALSEQSYPARLQRQLDIKVINGGVPGERTAAGRKRLPGLLDLHQPDLLILCHGGNDMLRKTGIDNMTENLRAMIEAALQRNIKVVLIAVPEPGLLLSPHDVYEMLAQEYGIPIEADILSDILSDSSLKSDTIHPNARGYQKMADAIVSLLQRNQAISNN